jgi:uncharacterized OsmC-like protein/fermentation-respiration switch protein FrsA (DUF1100 family)
MQSIKVKFPNSAGEELAGILDVPFGEPAAYALFAHCFTCSKNLKAATNISRSMTAAGIAVLRFDFTGLGESDGAFEDSSFSSTVADLLSAVHWLEKEYRSPEILFGHSLGGTAVLQAAASVPSAVAVATIGSPSDPAHVAHMFRDSEAALRENGVAEVQLGGRPFRVRKQFLDDLSRHKLPEAVSDLRKALLVMHAPLDDVVDVENASALFAAALHPKSFVSLDKADHLMSREADSKYAGQVLASWASRYLPSAPAPKESPLAAAEGFVVAQTKIAGFRTAVSAGNHAFLADEPLSVGGTDAGPTPYDLLSAALATCTSITLRMYARLKNIELRSATVAVRHGRVHAEDCGDCESAAGKIAEFQRVLTLDGELTEEQRQRMLEIADRCPVHKTLHGEIKVRTTLTGP